MSKLADLDRIMKGTRAIKRVDFPLANVPGPLQADQPEFAEARAKEPDAPTSWEVGIRVFDGDVTALVYQKAWESAQARGCAKPDEQDPLYAFLLSAWTVALACVDPDSDPARPALFFGETPDAAFAAVMSHPSVGRDGVHYLGECHEHWQDLCHPQAKNINPGQLWAVICEAVASDDPRPFLKMRPGTRWSSMRSMARQLLDLLQDKSSPGTSSENSGESAPGLSN